MSDSDSAETIFCIFRGGAVGAVLRVQESNTRLATIATCTVPPAELAIVSTRSVRA